MKKINVKHLIICLMLSIFAFAQTAAAQNKNSKTVNEVTDATFNQYTQKGIVVVDFWATWCRPCLTQAPILEDVADEMSKVKFYKMDVDKNKQASSQYGIRSIPTIIVFKNGKEVKRLIGVQNKEVLKQEIGRFL